MVARSWACGKADMSTSHQSYIPKSPWISITGSRSGGWLFLSLSDKFNQPMKHRALVPLAGELFLLTYVTLGSLIAPKLRDPLRVAGSGWSDAGFCRVCQRRSKYLNMKNDLVFIIWLSEWIHQNDSRGYWCRLEETGGERSSQMKPNLFNGKSTGI